MSRPSEPMPRAEAAALLGVGADASGADVRRAFLRAARRVHPDLAGQDAERSAAAFIRLAMARDVLLTPDPGSDDVLLDRATSAPVVARRRDRGLADSLVLLALLAFVLVGLATVLQGFPGVPVDLPRAP